MNLDPAEYDGTDQDFVRLGVLFFDLAKSRVLENKIDSAVMVADFAGAYPDAPPSFLEFLVAFGDWMVDGIRNNEPQCRSREAIRAALQDVVDRNQ